MPKKIVISGAPGAGKTTLAKELAILLEYKHIDLDDFYHRKDAKIPFSERTPPEEVRERVMNEISIHPNFVMSGTIGNILGDLLNPMFDLAVLLLVPTDIRLERVRARESAWFGERILQGGDMYENHLEHIKKVEFFDTDEPPSVCLKRLELWASALSCPVLRLDGTKPTTENAAWLVEKICS